MKMNSNLRSTFAVAAVLFLAVVLLHSLGRNVATKSTDRGELEGAWRIQVNPRNWQTGAPGPSFDTLMMFHRGGTASELLNSPAFQPGQRTPGFGVWSHSRGNSYKAVVDAFILFDSPSPGPFKRGVQRIVRDIKVDGDQFTLESSGQLLDAGGNQYGAQCASATGTRFEGP